MSKVTVFDPAGKKVVQNVPVIKQMALTLYLIKLGAVMYTAAYNKKDKDKEIFETIRENYSEVELACRVYECLSKQSKVVLNSVATKKEGKIDLSGDRTDLTDGSVGVQVMLYSVSKQEVGVRYVFTKYNADTDEVEDTITDMVTISVEDIESVTNISNDVENSVLSTKERKFTFGKKKKVSKFSHPDLPTVLEELGREFANTGVTKNTSTTTTDKTLDALINGITTKNKEMANA